MAEIGQAIIRGRRLIACCDGTWNKPDRQRHTTNVVRLVRSIDACTEDGISQIVYYRPGLGTGNFVDRWIGGGTGIGLSENVRSVYAWLLDNYRHGDEIFLFGFSRGAYTARAVPGIEAGRRSRAKCWRSGAGDGVNQAWRSRLSFSRIADRGSRDEWRVEWFDDDGTCEVAIFAGPNARERAIRYADRQYGCSNRPT